MEPAAPEPDEERPPAERIAVEPVTIEADHSPRINRQQNYILSLRNHTVQVTVTSTPRVVHNWVDAVIHRARFRHDRLVVGLGVQWFHENSNVAATLQLCVGHRCLIFQLRHAQQSPATLRRFLRDSRIIFVGFDNFRDRQMLANTHHALVTRPLVELQEVASALRGCRRDATVSDLASDILQFRRVVMNGMVAQSDWTQRWLSEEQVTYATLDAFLAFLVAITLQVSHNWNLH